MRWLSFLTILRNEGLNSLEQYVFHGYYRSSIQRLQVLLIKKTEHLHSLDPVRSILIQLTSR
jgi:hypothetical protein